MEKHLQHARHYAALHPMSVTNLLRLAEGKRPKRTIKEQFRILICKLIGHNLIVDYWVKDDPNCFSNKQYELHLGCTRCPFIATKKPKNFISKYKPVARLPE
jgi:hypothetical protein